MKQKPKTEKQKRRELLLAWQKVNRLGRCYCDLSSKKRSVKESLFEAIAVAAKLENNPQAWRLDKFLR